jgi:Hint module
MEGSLHYFSPYYGMTAQQAQAAWNISHSSLNNLIHAYERAIVTRHGEDSDYPVPTPHADDAADRAYFHALPQEPTPPTSFTRGGFPASTSVFLANGTEKLIEHLRRGEQVLACDDTKQVTTTILACITLPAREVYELKFSNGTILTTTDSHPIATPWGWKALSVEQAGQENPDMPITGLHQGDFVYTVEGIRSLFSIEKRQIVPLFNILVDYPCTFYANGILVYSKAEQMTSGPEQQASD